MTSRDHWIACCFLGLLLVLGGYQQPLASADSPAAPESSSPLMSSDIDQWDQESAELAELIAARQERLTHQRRTASELDLEQRRGGENEAAAGVLQKQIDGTARQIAKLEASIDRLRRQQQTLARRIEARLRADGQWVSFTDQIAPLFQRSCVVCHNPRQSQGRYNMANYASLMGSSDSGKAIIAGDPDGSLLLSLIEDGSMPVDAPPLQEEEVALLRRWIHSGARIDSSADRDAPLSRLIPRPVQPSAPLVYPLAPPVTALAWHPDGQHLASSGYHEVLLWRLPTEAEAGPPRLLKRFGDFPERILGLDFDSQGQRLAVASGTPGQWGEVRVLEVESGEVLADLGTSADSFRAVAFSPDGQRIAAAANDGCIVVSTASEQGWSSKRLEFHSDWVTAIAWSADSRYLVSSSRDKTNKLIDVQQERPVGTFTGHEHTVVGAYFLEDDKQIVSGGEDRKLRRWTRAETKQNKHITTASSPLSGVIPWGVGRALSISGDRRVRIHDLETGESLASLVTPEPWLTSLRPSPNRDRIAFGSHGGTIFIAAPTTEQLNLQLQWPAVPQESMAPQSDGSEVVYPADE